MRRGTLSPAMNPGMTVELGGAAHASPQPIHKPAAVVGEGAAGGFDTDDAEGGVGAVSDVRADGVVRGA